MIMKFKPVSLLIAFVLLANTNVWSQTKYVYQEEFKEQGTWTLGNNEIRELYVSNGKYYFEHKKKEGSRNFSTRSFYLDFSKDFEIETLIGQKIKRVYLEGYEVSNREVLIDKIGKKPAHLRRTRANKPSGQATGEARAKNRSRISNVRKSLKGEKLSLKK